MCFIKRESYKGGKLLYAMAKHIRGKIHVICECVENRPV